MILANGAEQLDLPDGMDVVGLWGWTPQAIDEGRGLTGKMIRTESAKVKGQALTVRSPSNNLGLLTQEQIETLQDWSAEAGVEMVLTVAVDLQFDVAFRHENGQAFTAEPVRGFTYKGRSDWWRVDLFLISIEVP